MKLTKRKSLELSIELWSWMLENIGNHKSLWPRWSEFAGFVGDDIEADCFLCEYDLMQTEKYIYAKDSCYYCPLKKEFNCCDDSRTPFSIWHKNKSYQNTKMMLDIMKKKYDELYVKEN